MTMRPLAFILAIIILISCSLPCADMCSIADTDKTQKTEGTASHGEEHQDFCSPFCHCSCCATVAIAPQSAVTVFTSKDVPGESLYHEYVPVAGINVSLPIWQPPRA